MTYGRKRNILYIAIFDCVIFFLRDCKTILRDKHSRCVPEQHNTRVYTQRFYCTHILYFFLYAVYGDAF